MAHIKPLNGKAYLYIAAFFAIMLAASLIMSCGNDSITNTGTNPGNETLIYSQDSLSLITPPFTKDTTVKFSSISNIKINFDAETNADSINGWALFKVNAVDSANNTTILDTTYNKTLHMNNSYTISLNNLTSTIFINLYIQCLRNSPYVFYMRLKNIKIYSIN